MPSPEATPTGVDWQKQVTRLCHIQCGMRGEVYQPVPDTVDGDHGLEGFTTDGEGYQCYSDQDTVSVPDRVRKQKEKITRDLRKLKTYESFWAGIFGATKLRRWYLVTPDVPDKAVLTHARTKARQLRGMGLPFIDAAFEAFVVTDDHFQQAQEWLASLGTTVVDFSPDEADEADLVKIPSEFVANTERKLKQVRPNDGETAIRVQRDRYLVWYLESQNVLGKLLSEYPDIWERLERFRAQQKKDVQFESDLDDTRPSQRLMNVHKTLATDLDRDFKMLGKPTINAITLGSIAEWLGLCPLQFLPRDDHEQRD